MAYNFKTIEENANSPFDTKAPGQKRTFCEKSSVKKNMHFHFGE